MRPPRIRSVRIIAVLSTAVLVMSAAQAAAQSPTGWSQFQADATHAGVAPVGPAPGYRSAWEASTATGGPEGAYGLSAPVIADGVAVAVGPTEVVGIEVSSGTPAWAVDRLLGPSTSPAIAQGPDGPLVVFTEGWGDGPSGSDASATPSVTVSPSPSASAGSAAGTGEPIEPAVSRLVAVAIDGGEQAWSVDLPAVSRTGVTVVGDLAVVGSIDGTVTAADLSTGEVAWTASVGGFLETPPAASEDSVLVSVRGDDDTSAAVVALGVTDGAETWRYEPVTASFTLGPPSIGGDAAYVALADGTVRSVALADGTERWRVSLNTYVNPFAPASAPVVSDDAVIVVDVRGQVYRLDSTTGDRVWDHAYNRPVVRSAPVVIGDQVVVATADGHVAAFELDGGDLVWEGEAGSDPLRSLAVAEDTLVIVRGGVSAGMVGLQHDPDAGLTRVVSPTVLDLPTLLLSWGAALLVAVLLFLGGRALWARLGPPEIPSEDDADVEEGP